MGNTCTSVHVALTGAVPDPIEGIVRAYATLGFEPTKNPSPEAKHVVLLVHEGDTFLSIYDSDNAALDSGELKELALAASTLFKSATVCTSLYDSDTFEFVVFNAGKQIDLLLTNQEEYSGPLKVLRGKTRTTQWSKAFGRPLLLERITAAATPDSAFSDDAIAGLSELIGLPGGRSQLNYQDVRDDQARTHLHFSKRKGAPRAAAGGPIVLTDYFDPDASRVLMVNPARWPVPLDEESRVTWLMLSVGAGFTQGTLVIRVTGPDGLAITRGHMDGSKFHNGQIVGPLETAPRDAGASVEEQIKARQFEVTQEPADVADSRTFTARFPALDIPAKAPDRPTQILIVLQLHLMASRPGEWDIDVSVRPGSGATNHDLPRARIAAVEQTWLPIVSGLNAKAPYDTGDLAALQPKGPTLLRELQHAQASILRDRTLTHFAIASNAVVLRDQGQAALAACRSFLEGWLQPLTGTSGEIRIRAEKRMTERAYVGKTRKTLPLTVFLRDKAWAKLFAAGSDYQTVLADVFEKDAPYPIAGVGVQVGLETHPEQWRDHYEQRMARTLSTMRGRQFEAAPVVNTVHVFTWVLNHDDCYRYLATTIEDMKNRLDDFASQHAILQGWHSQSTWRPLFDQADDYHRTVYEDHSVLNWFRGILQDDGGLEASKMSLQWCSNVLRMVTPHMWIGRSLIQQVDRAVLDTVARVLEANDAFKVTLREDRGLDELELALLSVLPVESARVRPR